MKGFFNKILRINLRTKSFREETIPDSVYETYLGGKGLGTYLLVNQSTGEYFPLPQIFDWDAILQDLHDYAASRKRDYGQSKLPGALKLARTLW